MPLADDEFKQKMQMLGLDMDESPVSQEDTSSIEDPAMQDAPIDIPKAPGIGFEGNPGQEKSPLIAATPEDQEAATNALMPAPVPREPNMSVQPAAQVVSSDPNDDGGAFNDPKAVDPATGLPMGTKTPAGVAKTPQDKEAKDAISNVVQNPTVADYIRKNYGSNADLNDVAMAEAQEIANTKRLIGGLGGAFDRLVSGATQTKGQPEFFSDVVKNADSGVKDIQTRRKALSDEAKLKVDQLTADEKTDDNDPNSPAAAAVRKMYGGVLKGFGMDEKILDSASPRVIKTYMDQVIRAKDASEARKLIAEQNRAAREAAAKEKAEKSAVERVTKFSEALDPNKARAGNLATSQQLFNNAEKLEGLVNKSAAGMNLDQREAEDFALGLAKMLSGSNATSRAQVEALVPRTARGNAKKMTEWLTNEPQGLDQQKFVARMVATVQREKQIANQQKREAQMQRIAGFNDIPDDKRIDVMQSYGIQPEDYQTFLEERRGGKVTGVDFDKIKGHEESKKTDKAPASSSAPKTAISTGTVTVRRKSDGAIKTLPADKAATYLADPAFEEIK